MIRNDELFALNAFEPHAIPTARKLFERYGYSRVTDGHPDNTDPFHFSTPSNMQGVIPGVGSVSLGASVADSLLLSTQEQVPPQPKPEPEPQPEPEAK